MESVRTFFVPKLDCAVVLVICLGYRIRKIVCEITGAIRAYFESICRHAFFAFLHTRETLLRGTSSRWCRGWSLRSRTLYPRWFSRSTLPKAILLWVLLLLLLIAIINCRGSWRRPICRFYFMAYESFLVPLRWRTCYRGERRGGERRHRFWRHRFIVGTGRTVAVAADAAAAIPHIIAVICGRYGYVWFRLIIIRLLLRNGRRRLWRLFKLQLLLQLWLVLLFGIVESVIIDGRGGCYVAVLVGHNNWLLRCIAAHFERSFTDNPNQQWHRNENNNITTDSLLLSSRYLYYYSKRNHIHNLIQLIGGACLFAQIACTEIHGWLTYDDQIPKSHPTSCSLSRG